jgi:hypothetical protein
LDQIIRGDDIARQCARVSPKAWDLGFDVPVRVGHMRSFPYENQPGWPI